jgi:SPP1 family predicted phage head-tail adaptor
MPTTKSQSGSLRTRVRIDSQTRTPDGQGGYALAWTPLLTTHAERVDLSGSEALRAMQVTANSMRRYRLRLPPSLNIDASMRVVDLRTGETFNIRNTNEPDQLHRWVVLLCEFVPGSTGA